MKKNSNPTSKKQVLENYLLSEIHSGNLKVGDLIPSESELVKKFGFGRQTVHNVLYDLALKGVITRSKGKGSFVAYKPVNRNIQRKMSFTQDMQSIGMIPGAKLLEYKIIKAKEFPDIIHDLHIHEDEEVYFMKRLRTGNNIPIALQYYYIPARFLPNIDLTALTGSIDEYVARQGIDVKGFVTKLSAVEGTDEQTGLLETETHALLKSISIRFIEKDIPFQYTITYYRSDLYEYTFSSFQ
ncbi:GntR family transcriptional regulator [Anaerorhabdus sp.]|uniref:GntR family transcriptional regulator n=1 Tax=Anaerorhabdus sp. TaxID=1872524 RepID=UPI002B1FA0DF|nr:GntR family transcriptional regulator [Anaerorhabdus sp.]MEA4874912.1 GntR family transcriptional regulator [Anaerorhabdus sp.]